MSIGERHIQINSEIIFLKYLYSILDSSITIFNEISFLEIDRSFEKLTIGQRRWERHMRSYVWPRVLEFVEVKTYRLHDYGIVRIAICRSRARIPSADDIVSIRAAKRGRIVRKVLYGWTIDKKPRNIPSLRCRSDRRERHFVHHFGHPIVHKSRHVVLRKEQIIWYKELFL